MKETGTVTKVKGTRAVVSVEKKDECSRCGLCLFKEGAARTEFYARNDACAKVGDRVIVERSENGKFLGAVLAFLVPLMLIGLAVLIDFLFIKNEIWILILSAAFIAVWYVVLALIDKTLGKSRVFDSRVTEIMTPDGTENAENYTDEIKDNTDETH